MAMGLLQGVAGVIIVMDMDNGEILGLVNSPDYNPNTFTDSQLNKNVSQLFSNPKAPLLNRAIKGLYPPGSVFKVSVAIGGLDSKKITQNTTFVCPGYKELGGIKFGCTHIHGAENLIEALAHSCNVYFYNLGFMLGSDLMAEYAMGLGLGRRTHIHWARGYVDNSYTAGQDDGDHRQRWLRSQPACDLFH